MKIKITDVRALPGDSAFLVDDGKTAILYDSGFAFTGEAVAEKIAAALGDRSLDYIFLTHSHYDHALGAAYVLRAYPDKVVGGIKIVMRALSLRKSILVMTEHMQTEAAAIRERLEQKNLIDIYGVVSKYPAESDKVMFSALRAASFTASSICLSKFLISVFLAEIF